MTEREALEEAVRLFESCGLVAGRTVGDPLAAGRWINQARAALAATPSRIQGALALYLNEVKPVDGRVQINISLDELSVLRRLTAATAAVGGEPTALIPRILERADNYIKDNGYEDAYTCNLVSDMAHLLRQPVTPAVGGEARDIGNYVQHHQDCDVFDKLKRTCTCGLSEALAQPASPLRGIEMDLKTSEEDESLMRATLLKCYSEGPYAFRVSKEHYLYLAEQIIALREGSRRMAAASPLRGSMEDELKSAAQTLFDNAVRLIQCLADSNWRPSRTHVEGARNTMQQVAATLGRIAASPPQHPAAQIVEPRTAAGSLD